jgi:hypothetical protein
MAIDPSIPLQTGRVQTQLQDPMDLAAKGMSMQQLAYKNQEMQRDMQNQQDLKAAYAQAMTPGKDGAPSLDRQKFMTALSTNPMLAYQQQQGFAATDAAKAKSDLEVDKARHEKAAEIAWSIPTDPNTPPEQKQSAWTAARNKALALGLPGADQSPAQYPGDSFVQQYQMHTLDAQKQAEMQEKKSEFSQREKDRQLQREQMGGQKQNQALQQTQSILESARGNPAVAQAQKDIYAAQKFESLVNLYGDPNKLNPQQVQLAASEVGKIATGGVPSVHELQGLNQATLPGELASLAQAALNHPQGAEAGAFVKALGDYVSSLKKDAQNVVKEKFGRVIETRRGQLGEQHYKDLKSQYLDPLNDVAKAAADTKVYNGVTYKIENGHWVPQ